MAQLQIPIDDALMARLKAKAASRMLTLKEFVNRTLERSVREPRKQEPRA